ncbi:hypothetical protein GEV33_004395 [Tenebrio molitor]|uniref:Uncharacterized protein n=1 Tax=Tenebrio molitor TaxID=7067 RepID=A0A8J6HGJ7_TENMO|nr:hypothetical protein GEV33_004395 [Tenebrio molitor]
MVRAGGAFPLSRFLTAVPARAPNYVTITYGSDVTGFDAVRVGRGMPRAPVPFCGCGGTPHGRGSFAERGCRRGARLVLTVVLVGPGRCWLFLFGAKERGVDGKRDGRGSLTAGRNGPGRREKAGRPGFPRNGRERARTKGESGMAWVPSQWEVTGQEEKGESGMAWVPSQWEGTGQEEKKKAGWPGFPRNGKERARKKRRERDGRGSLAMGRNGPGRKGESGMAVVPSQWEGTGQVGRERDENRNRNRNELCRLGAVFCCLGRAMVGLRAADDSRLERWGSSAEQGVPVLSARRNTGSVADSVDAVKAVGSALIFCTGSEKERNFSATGSVSYDFCELVSPAHTILDVSDNDDDFEYLEKALEEERFGHVKKHYKGTRDSDSDSNIKIIKGYWQRQLVRSYKRKLAEKAKYDRVDADY